MKLCPLSELRARVAAGPPYGEDLLALLRGDERAGARRLHEACLRRQERADIELGRQEAMLEFERAAEAEGFKCVAGVDEAGRGPLAGPLVAAAVVLREPVAGLDDSKQLTAAQRDAFYGLLTEGGHSLGVCVVDPFEIDRGGIQAANYSAMHRAAMALERRPDFLLVDGFSIPGCPIPQKRLVKGDRRSQSIAAASIIAKVTRDRIMDELDRAYPEYGFARHKGYGTVEHLAAIEEYGPCAAHRMSFAPIARQAETGFLFAEDNEEGF